MEYSWKLSDDELFDPEGLPRNGKCAPGREGDILDIVQKSIRGADQDLFRKRLEHYKAVDEANAKLADLIDDIEYGFDVDPVAIRQCEVIAIEHDFSDMDRDLHTRIDQNINAVWNSRGKLYIGRLPQAGPIATAKKGKKSQEISYFAGEESPSRIIHNTLDKADDEVAQLRYYTASPLYELGHFFCKILLLMVKALQIFLAYNESLFFDNQETISFLPLLFPDSPHGPLYLNALIWLVFGALIFYIVAEANNYFTARDDDAALFAFGYLIFAPVHALLATRTLLGYFVGGVGLLISTLFVIYDLYLIGKTFVRIFQRMRYSRLLPPPSKYGVAYSCDFESTARSLYRYIRLRTIWYETVYQKEAPSDYQKAITKLEKLDKTYQRYNKIALKRRKTDPRMEEAYRILNEKK